METINSPLIPTTEEASTIQVTTSVRISNARNVTIEWKRLSGYDCTGDDAPTHSVNEEESWSNGVVLRISSDDKFEVIFREDGVMEINGNYTSKVESMLLDAVSLLVAKIKMPTVEAKKKRYTVDIPEDDIKLSSSITPYFFSVKCVL